MGRVCNAWHPADLDYEWASEAIQPIPFYKGYYEGFKSGSEGYGPAAMLSSDLREKDFTSTHKSVYSVVDGDRIFYYGQMEVVIALGPSIRLGMHPGEFVDFLLGWFRIDIYDDDMEQR